MAARSSTQNQIPVFRSIEEEAEFWDTHDSTQFDGEWTPVQVEIAPNAVSRYIVEFDLDDEPFRLLREAARARGLRAADLARLWVLDEIRRSGGQETTDRSSRPTSTD